jgi:hemoglobin
MANAARSSSDAPVHFYPFFYQGENTMKRLILVGLAVMLASCAQTPPPAPVAKLKDGELAVPTDYRQWKTRLLNVQRADAKQIRDIYLNDVGAKAKPGETFAHGSMSVMELYAAKALPDGALEKGADGKLVKGNLLKVFVMGKNEGWGKDDMPANGEWIYSAFMPDAKTKAPDPTIACRTCHLNNVGAAKDYFARHDEIVAANQ